ncbi:GAF domain-containing protein [Thermoflavimicrobium dichotomicum]|uniref:GAF domain-containing protein n=1 Tax=Thermoflavimicrobium dichotomicum TaxID=46223 RepID=A0A1I3MD19_9BACL|nr:GAF domain-containing protein [Thermoflavimicrobium dichotomicum]SFI94868.1 GAF domain-containing protein [Thermoflavimicrobium dichotomicum]
MFVFEQAKGNKEANYEQMLKQCEALLEGETDWLANLANTASHLFHVLPDINWAGYYLMKDGELVLGPFQGKPACVRIPVGKGVCGTAVAKEQTMVVEDVLAFPGHIACDAASRSEIVIPLRIDGKIVGVLDIDSPVEKRFDQVDQKYLEAYVAIVLSHTDWSPILNGSCFA